MDSHSSPTYQVKIRRALRERDVLAQVGFSKSQLWRLIQQGKFPKPARISERCNAWDSVLVEQWLANKFDLPQDLSK